MTDWAGKIGYPAALRLLAKDHERRARAGLLLNDAADEIDRMRGEIKTLLSLAPAGTVPKGLDPSFYHTLTYKGDVELQNKINAIRQRQERLQ